MPTPDATFTTTTTPSPSSASNQNDQTGQTATTPGPWRAPGRRYYGGCEHVDVAESLAIERIKALFSARYANVQPHSDALGARGLT